MKQYIDLLKKILDNGTVGDDRTGTGTISIFSDTLKFNMEDGFPLVTTKYINYKAVLNELLWFISGSKNIFDLDSKIWDAWATDDGDIGPMYGYQWNKHNQLDNVIENIKSNPYSRRLIVSAWNVSYLPNEKLSPQDNVKKGKMSLAPCHKDFQFYVRNGKLSLHWNQRSVDAFLGLPFNIASYATLLIMVSKLTGLKPHLLTFHGVDIHIYMNHMDQVRKQIEKKTLPLSDLHVKDKKNIHKYKYEDFELINYEHHSKLPGKISV